MQEARKVRVMCTIVVAGLIAATLYHLVLGRVFGLGYPANTFLWIPKDRFSDFYVIFEPVQRGSPLEGKQSVYFPFAYVPLFPFSVLTWPVTMGLMFSTYAAVIFYLFWRELSFLPNVRHVLAAVIIPFCSFPVLFCADRGNIEFIVALYEIAFFWLFTRQRYVLSALPLAAAIATKAYPGALGVLLLSRRQYGAAGLTAILTAALTFAAAAAYPGGVTGTAKLMQERLQFLQEVYVTNPVSYASSSNWLCAFKLVLHALHKNFAAHSTVFLRLYGAGSAVIFAVVAWYTVKHERTLWKQVYLLTALMIALPQVSFDYKLLHLLLPTALFLAAPPGRRGDDRLYLGLLGSLLIPKRYFPIGTEASLSILLNPLALTVMGAHIMWRGWRAPPAGDRPFAAALTV